MRSSRYLRILLTLTLVLAGAVVTVGPAAPGAQGATCYTWYRTLRQGMTGSDVAELQIRVAGWAGYGVNIAIDGNYGTQTTEAVRGFQRAYGLDPDGVAGPLTFSKIYSLQKADCSPLHFSWAEVSTNCGRGLNSNGSVPLAEVKENLKRVMWRAEALRHQLGDTPITVTSGFRDKACDGHPYGQHTYGKALDLVRVQSIADLCVVARQARYAGAGGLFGPGYPAHDNHVHFDIRAGRVWSAPTCGITS